MTELFAPVVTWYMGHINYATVCILMIIESSFIPFPSEIIVPPAAWKAAQGQLNFGLVLFWATVGAMIGAFFNYYLALWLGRPVLYRLADTRWAHLFLINRDGVKKAEDFFNKYGKLSTFIGRLVFAVRQLISLPAGLARMDLKAFALYTFLGAGIWNLLLALMGYYLYSQKEMLDRYYSELTWIGIGMGALAVSFLLWKNLKK